MRRTVRAMRLMGVDAATFGELFPASRDAMKAAYPEVSDDFDRISRLAYAEEETFLRTLSGGTTILDVAVGETKAKGGERIAGDTAFLLHDTFGFPIDLTLEMAEENGLTVDREAFDRLMLEQRTRAKADAKSKKTALADLTVYSEFRAAGETRFTGYDELETGTTILGLIVGGRSVDHAVAGDIAEVILPRRASTRSPAARRPTRAASSARASIRGARRAEAREGPHQPPRAGAVGRGGRGRRRHDGRRRRLAPRRDPGALGHAPRPRRAPPGARPGRSPVRLLQPGRLHAPRLRVEPGAQLRDAQRDRGHRERRGA